MFCPNCGSQADDNAKFCTVCGAVLPHLDEPKPQSDNNTVQTAESKAPFGAAYENPPRPANAPVDNSPFGAAYETPQTMQQYNRPNNYNPYNNPYNTPYNGPYNNNPPPYQPQYNSAPAENNNTIALVGFILSFFVPIAGLICSIIGLRNVKVTGKRKGLAIAGIVISAVTMFFNLIFQIAFQEAYYELLFGLYSVSAL